MADVQTYTGTVASVEKGPGASKTYKVTCTTQNGEYTNEKKFVVWPNQYQSEEPNPNLTKLQASIGQVVTVQFTTKQKTYNNKTWPENTIQEVDVVGGGAAPGQSPSQGAPPSAASQKDDWGVSVAPLVQGGNGPAIGALADIIAASAQDLMGIAEQVRKLSAPQPEPAEF